MEPRVLTYELKGEGEPIPLVPGGLTGWLSWIPHGEEQAHEQPLERIRFGGR
jgi:hypothetical protein